VRVIRTLFVLTLILVVVHSSATTGRAATGQPTFTSSASLRLHKSDLPRGYAVVGYFVQDSVQAWDGNLSPVVAIDQKNGWMEAVEEKALDPSKRDVLLSVQLFRTAQGARSDFSLFFTNDHPETRFQPDATWLGASAIRGLGVVANLYHILDDNSRCPRHLTAGVSFVYGNGIFSSSVCTRTVGDRAAKDLAWRLFSRARKIAGR
jgi:hypothetical protein